MVLLTSSAVAVFVTVTGCATALSHEVAVLAKPESWSLFGVVFFVKATLAENCPEPIIGTEIPGLPLTLIRPVNVSPCGGGGETMAETVT